MREKSSRFQQMEIGLDLQISAPIKSRERFFQILRAVPHQIHHSICFISFSKANIYLFHRFFRRPSTPRTQTMARRPIIGTLTNRKSSYGVSQPSLEGEIDSPLKLYGLQLPNRTSPKFGELESSERRVHQGNNEPVYHCCELENDEDSVILNLINNNQNFAGKKLCYLRCLPYFELDKYKNEFNNDVLENQKGGKFRSHA